MERFWDTVRGYARVKITGAEPAAFLDLCLSEGLEFWGMVPEDEFTLFLTMKLSDSEQAGVLAEKCFCQAEILKRGGGPVAAKSLKRRFVFPVVALILFAVLTASSLFIWRIDLEGNKTVSDTRILNALEDNGVYVGSYWPSFNSEIIRSRILEQIPELKWLSVSLFGSRVHIEVREREPAPELFDESEYYKMTASKGGLITQVSVLRGVGKVAVGDTAAAGDLLIDGTVYSPFAGARFVHASGSVEARTWYELTAVIPMEYTEKTYTGHTKTHHALKIGSKRINFYGSSGIWGTKCDNIITEGPLGIEGLFTLPVSLVTMTMEEYTEHRAVLSEDEAKRRLEEILNSQLLGSMTEDGKVTMAEFTFTVTDGFGVGTLRAECLEDIAEEKPLSTEEIFGARTESEDNSSQ